MPTTWNLGKQYADPAIVPDEGCARIQGILAMPKGRRNGHALITSEVLEFTGWLPYRTRVEFTKYRVDHPELEPFTAYNFNAPDQSYNKGAEEEGGSSHDYPLCMVGLQFSSQHLTLLMLL